ncbi:uncharacterized protein LOC125742332 [Brienomyrus brachyistius]|uniref:uncharacterized protein LOC125742332 n=1 Tax=Brienomyrus brachyistius TaxID=42636 RepID=UPI0020B40F4E|nr:uncharacterized protein LOC125742332 [Brienomyrus brachyistius]
MAGDVSVNTNYRLGGAQVSLDASWGRGGSPAREGSRGHDLKQPALEVTSGRYQRTWESDPGKRADTLLWSALVVLTRMDATASRALANPEANRCPDDSGPPESQVERRTGTDIAVDAVSGQPYNGPTLRARGSHSDLRDCGGSRARAAETNRPSVPTAWTQQEPKFRWKKGAVRQVRYAHTATAAGSMRLHGPCWRGSSFWDRLVTSLRKHVFLAEFPESGNV